MNEIIQMINDVVAFNERPAVFLSGGIDSAIVLHHLRQRRGGRGIRTYAAIFGIEGEGVVGPARGVPQRLDWWASIWQTLSADPLTLLFGMGYGRPLIDFAAFQISFSRCR